MTPKEVLMVVLDLVDYTSGACKPTEMIGAILPKEIIALAKKTIKEDDDAAQPRDGSE